MLFLKDALSISKPDTSLLFKFNHLYEWNLNLVCTALVDGLAHGVAKPLSDRLRTTCPIRGSYPYL